MDSKTMDRATAGGGRTTWLVGALVAVGLVIAAAVALTMAGSRESAEYPPDSPEAAFQRYAEAWDAGDVDAAWDALTVRAQGRTSRWEFRDASTWRAEESHRVWIDERSGADERVVLHLTIETIYEGGIFGSDRYEEHSRVVMVREDGEWKIDTPLVGYHVW